ncbi:helix-turn-helix transcriptional regulator [Sulfurimonas sp.]|uniref:helix-turn-helix transcriptional regulator n=1 Tax=Sulfurimonas sp. TaxID=2022749 RepID=UPI003568A9C2
MAYKHDYDKTLTRLNTIIARLNDGEELSVKELAKEFNVSERTIQRDFNNRLVSLYPIYQDKKKWKMQDGYKIEKSTNNEELIVLDILEKMTDGLGINFSSKAKHLLSKIKNNDLNPFYAKLNMEDISTKLSDIAMLERSIKEKQQIVFVYNFGEYTREIRVKPLKIANYEGYWYLIALDSRNDVLKKYHLKSINNIQILDENFLVSKELEENLNNSINVWFNADVKPYDVELFLDKYAAKSLKRKPISLTQRVIKEYSDGSMEISVSVTDDMEIIPIIGYWVPHIKIISPDSLKESFLKRLHEYLD